MTTEQQPKPVNRRSALGTLGAFGALALATPGARAQQGDANQASPEPAAADPAMQ